MTGLPSWLPLGSKGVGLALAHQTFGPEAAAAAPLGSRPVSSSGRRLREPAPPRASSEPAKGCCPVCPARTSARHGRENGCARGVGSHDADMRSAFRGVGLLFRADPCSVRGSQNAAPPAGSGTGVEFAHESTSLPVATSSSLKPKEVSGFMV